ncbi:MAG: asparagine synthetase B family protein, partial [Pirellulales bacterium]
TLFDGVTSLPPGAFQQYMASGDAWRKSEPTPFWTFPELQSEVTECEALDCVSALVDRAVCDHLVADVPVGIFLSAGLDSTILAGLAARHSGQTRAFTVGFSDQPDMSEMDLAAETAARFGLPHTPINLPADEAEAAAFEWLAAADQPSIDGLNTFVVSKAVRKEGIKVALSGLGSDELFGGYPSFRDVPRLARVTRELAWCPASVRRGAAAVVAVRKPRAVGRKLVDMMGGAGSLVDLYFHRRRALSNCEMKSLGFSPAALGLMPDYQHVGALDDFDASDPVRAVSELESRFYQGNMLLRDSDVMGMAHGLEIRVPFLDRRLLDAVYSLPGPVRLPPRAAGKHLLRGAFGQLLRPDMTHRPKTGFTLPLARWMRGPLRGVCQSALDACTEMASLPAAAVRRVWNEFTDE